VDPARAGVRDHGPPRRHPVPRSRSWT
jgi:hypothetical protein